jgi:hypothetical protein
MRYIAQLAKYGRFTSCPADVNGSVDIGMRFVTTGATPKLGLAGAVRLLAMSASRTGAAGVTRVYGNQRDASKLRLVLKEQAQLRERPTMENCSLPVPNRYPVTDAIEVFNRHPAPGAFSTGNDLLGYHMVCMRGKSLLLTGELAEPTFCRSRLFLLELGPQPSMAMANRSDMRTGAADAIRIRGDVSNAKIHAKEVRRLYRGGFRKVHRTVQVKLFSSIDQIRLTLDPVEPFLLVLTVDQRNDYAATWQRPKANAVHPLEGENSLVVGNRAMRFEDWAFAFVTTKALCRFANRTNSHLGRQTKAGTNLCVGQLLNAGRTEDFRLETNLGRKGGGFIGSLHRFEQPLALFGVRQKLQLERQFHYSGVYHSLLRKDGASSPCLKAGASAPKTR